MTRAATGKAALEADEPDLVLLDLRLPDIDGFEVCRRCASGRPSDHRRQRARGRGRPRRRAGARRRRLPGQAVRLPRADRAHPCRHAPAGVARVRPGPAARGRARGRSAGTPGESRRRRPPVDAARVRPARAARVGSGRGGQPEKIFEKVWETRWFGSPKTIDVHVATRFDGSSATRLDREPCAGSASGCAADVPSAPAQLPELTLIVLAVLEVPLGVTYGRNERRALETRVERDAVTVGRSPRACSRARARSRSRPCGRSRAGTSATRAAASSSSTAGGRALADSAPIPGDTSFASRPEIAAALSGRVASGVRHSNTLNADLLYVAVPVPPPPDPGRGADHVPEDRGRQPRAPLLADAARDRRDRAGGRLAARLWVARSVARPLRKLEHAAAEVGAGHLDVRAPEEGPEEVRRLAHEFNQTADKLEQLLESQQAFVADASHELRTPLTALRLRLENGRGGCRPCARGGRAPRSAGREPARTCPRGRGCGASEPVDVDAVCSRSDWRTGTASSIGGSAGLRVRSSPDRLGQILDNLVANAVAVSDSVDVSVIGEDGWVELHVVDHGPGLTEEERKRAFDRFWRGQGKSPGSGLGLAIVRRPGGCGRRRRRAASGAGRRCRRGRQAEVGVAMPGGETTIVFAAALGTALATGLGALPLLAVRTQGTRWLGLANAVASGVMLGASLSLLTEGGERGIIRTAAGALAGVAFVWAVQRSLGAGGEPHVGALSGADARKAVLIVAVMTAHSVAEGVGVGASFGGGNTLGLVIAIAIAIHNIPEGLAISLVLVRGACGSEPPPGGASSRACPSRYSGRPGLPLRRDVHVDSPGRARVRGRRDGLDGRDGVDPGGDRAPAVATSSRNVGACVRGDVHLPDRADPQLRPVPFLYSVEGDAADRLCQCGPTGGLAAPARRRASGAARSPDRHPAGRRSESLRGCGSSARPRSATCSSTARGATSGPSAKVGSPTCSASRRR